MFSGVRRWLSLEHPSSGRFAATYSPGEKAEPVLAKSIPAAILGAKIILHTGKLVSRSEEGLR
ncbi:hypothetical protein MPLSOD_160071 [Mesorhizobium sp. SOD10]|nr:hypothetical protein MPLSOD_160071 [Mesorhizobium sp. SOD10]